MGKRARGILMLAIAIVVVGALLVAGLLAWWAANGPGSDIVDVDDRPAWHTGLSTTTRADATTGSPTCRPSPAFTTSSGRTASRCRAGRAGRSRRTLRRRRGDTATRLAVPPTVGRFAAVTQTTPPAANPVIRGSAPYLALGATRHPGEGETKRFPLQPASASRFPTRAARWVRGLPGSARRTVRRVGSSRPGWGATSSSGRGGRRLPGRGCHG